MWVFANSRSLRSGIRSSFLKAALAGVVCICFGKVGLTKDAEDDDDSGKSSSAVPTIYLDLRTNYGSVPAGSLPIGLGSPALFSALQAPALSDPFGAKATMLGDLQRAHCLSHRLRRDTDQASESLFQLKEHSYSARDSQRTQGQKNRGRQVVRREQTKTSEQKDQPEN